MKISSIGVSFPSLRVTNSDLLRQLVEFNRAVDVEQINASCAKIESLLNKAGSQTRFYRDRSKNETALPMLLNAIYQALQKAEIGASDIDLLIYCGVGRGFLEPAMAYFVASELGISCECFDVTDACMSWVRALHIVDHYLAGSGYCKAMVINAEFNIYEYGYPELMKIDSLKKWQYTFPAFTIGEAATATVLTRSDDLWNFHFRSLPQHVGLCAIPLTGYGDYVSPEVTNLGLNGVSKFMCFGQELSRTASRAMSRFIRETYPEPQRFQKWFPHAATAVPYTHAAARLGLNGKVYTNVFPRYGNLVSASIPVALWMAAQENELHRGDRIVLCPISAGMSMALVDLIY